MAQLRRILLALLAAIATWLILKLILVPEDPLHIWLGSDKPITGTIISSSTITPWARSCTRAISPIEITPERTEAREVTVVIEPLGQANPKGRGSQVWIYVIASDLERVASTDWESVAMPSPWKYDPITHAVVFIGGERTHLKIKLKASGKISLGLARHPWCGQVRITIDGITRVVDLYTPESRSGPIEEAFLLPLPLEVTQRIETALPRTTSNFRLIFTDGPRTVRVERAEWRSRGDWVWGPSSGTVELGPGVEILRKSTQDWLLHITEPQGWIAFDKVQTKPFFLPGSWGLTVITFLWLLWWSALEAYRPRSRIGLLMRRQLYWAKYALPCLSVWLVYWLAFFPGLMSEDSIHQWAQMVQFRFEDWHPVFHTLTNWLITRVWFSPAAVALAQMLAMSILIGWGLAKFARLGVPSGLLWGVCSIFALSPVNGMMVITLWKDIPYSLSVLWLTLLMLEILVSRGKWLTQRRANTIVLAVALAFIALFRHQGVLVALGVVPILGVVYRACWKHVLVAFMVASGMYAVVRGPMYEALKVERLSGEKLCALPYSGRIHHVAAAIAAGTPLTSEERSVLHRIMPIDRWTALYTCGLVDPLISNTDFDPKALWQHRTEFRRIWLSLLLRNPGAILKHQLCVGSLAWGVPPYLSTVPIGIEPNDLGLSTRSQWPAMHQVLKDVVRWTRRRDIIGGLVWLPAVYLYVILLLTILVAYRTRDPNWLIFAVPASLQSFVLLLVNVAQDFRYQFSVYLIGLMSLCLLSFIVKPPREVAKGHERFEG